MGQRGPKRTPTKILELRGSWLANHRQDPEVPTAPPPCPRWLTRAGKALWHRLTKELTDTGLLATIDGHVLARYCHLSTVWVAAAQVCIKHGEAVEIYNDDGQLTDVRERREARRLVTVGAELLRIEQSFGMTPSARSGLANVQRLTSNAATDDKKTTRRLPRLG